MADTKITGMTATTTPASTDIAPIVVDPAGSPLNRKSTLANIITKAHGLGNTSAGSALTVVAGVIQNTALTGFGDVVGPASSTDNAIVRFDSTTGKLLQNSGITLSDLSGGAYELLSAADFKIRAAPTKNVVIYGGDGVGGNAGLTQITGGDGNETYAGGATGLSSGSGGDALGGVAAGTGGLSQMYAGDGGNAIAGAGNTAGTGGVATVASGYGGDGDTNNPGGAAGLLTIIGGDGGAGTATAAAGAGADVIITGGSAGSANGGTGAAGGNIYLTPGARSGSGSYSAVVIADTGAPTVTTNKLYSVSGALTWAGGALYKAGGTDVAVADGGTGASDAAGARTNLGLGTLATQSGTFSGTSSGTNTGDQTSIVGITGTIAQFNTAVTDADLAILGANTFTGVQTIPNITLPTGGQIKFTVPTGDLTSTGPTCGDYNSGYSSSAIGDLVYLDSSATWQKCDANTLALYNGLLGVALEVKASGAALLVALPGSFIYSTTGFPTWTIGSPIYMSETAGAMTQTQPTTTDAAIRVVGWAIHADKMFFFPSPDYITHT